MPLPQAGWVVYDSDDNAASTAAKAAATGRQHVIYSVHASFSGAATKLLQVKDGTTVIFAAYVVNSFTLHFPGGIAATPGAAVSAELAASGTGGMIGTVGLHGATF